MACRLLHVVEQPSADPYADADLKDLVGQFPSFYCTACTPLRPLPAGDVVKCLDRTEPCWKPAGRVCG